MKKLWNRFLRDVMSTIVVIIFDVIIFILILIYFNQTNVLIVLTLFLIFSCFLIVCTNYRKNSSVIREKMTNMFLVVVSVLTGIYMTEFFFTYCDTSVLAIRIQHNG
jgi:hypothetical protein